MFGSLTKEVSISNEFVAEFIAELDLNLAL
jgi:hypothetical protein